MPVARSSHPLRRRRPTGYRARGWASVRPIFVFGPGESEYRSMTFARLDPGTTVVALDDLSHNCETDTGIFDFVAGFERLEDPPYAFMERRGDSGTVVTHAEFPMIFGVDRFDHDVDVGPLRVLERIADEVHEHLLEGDPFRPQRRENTEYVDPGRRSRREHLDDLVDEFPHVD